MNLKRFDAIVLPKRERNTPTMSMNSKTGLVSFSAACIKKFNIQPGQRIFVYQDEKNPADWYFELTSDLTGWPLRLQKDTFFTFGSRGLVLEVFRSLKINARSCTFKLAAGATITDGRALWAIITSSAKTR